MSDSRQRLNLSHHQPSMAWLEALPEGLVESEIDLNLYRVEITPQSEGYLVYIGPHDSQLGGSAISIQIDAAGNLKDYWLETLAPISPPQGDDIEP